MSLPPSPNARTKILATIDHHGCFVRHYGDFYFLAAAELNSHLPPGMTFEDPASGLRAALSVISEIEIEPKAMTSMGSFRFDSPSEYRRHRRALSKAIRLFRSALKLKERVEALATAR